MYLYVLNFTVTSSDETPQIMNENVKEISVHVPKHKKPDNQEDFGHYLAGLIDGDGWFSNNTANLVLHELDYSLAYYVKKRIGYGIVSKLKTKNSIFYSIKKREGLLKFLTFINGKLRTQEKCNYIQKHLLEVDEDSFGLNDNFTINSVDNLNNYWLAGFIDSCGSFQLETEEYPQPKGDTLMKVRLVLKLSHKTPSVFDAIKSRLGGNITHDKETDTYYFATSTFESAKKVVEYINKYHILSSKYVDYVKWRKSYILVQNDFNVILSIDE
ncbi:hypothetical protein HK099_003325 [Clydaea vesicula]|uniref:Homing endonuclease LAGLIDADG domain-containing protein n=1 Tax=Clydaea vesicula TaxID=447962 RepID=A0AAD5U7B4_9FUNG|nr:hypothetical protein HK099_003325 [Clydaea vesicula]